MTRDGFFLLYDDDALLRSVAAESALWRISIDDRENGNGEEPQAGETVRAVRCETEEMASRVGRMRADFPSAGIIVLSAREMSSPTRGLLILAGADACLDGTSLPVEIVAALLALRRRGHALANGRAEGGGPAQVRSRALGWQLIEDGWSLAAPNGTSIELTRVERHLLQVLIANCPKPVERKNLVIDGLREGSLGRFVDVHISRIKRKAAITGTKLPVRAVRGEGYAFVGDNGGAAEPLA